MDTINAMNTLDSNLNRHLKHRLLIRVCFSPVIFASPREWGIREIEKFPSGSLGEWYYALKTNSSTPNNRADPNKRAGRKF